MDCLTGAGEPGQVTLGWQTGDRRYRDDTGEGQTLRERVAEMGAAQARGEGDDAHG